MGCFVVPVAQAIITTAVTRAVKAKEKEREALQTGEQSGSWGMEEGVPFSRKLKWLSKLLWGGSGLLAFEHLWHGEITLWFPFFTAMNDPAETAQMLREMATVGVAMSVAVTAVWAVMLVVSRAMEKKALKAQPSAK